MRETSLKTNVVKIFIIHVHLLNPRSTTVCLHLFGQTYVRLHVLEGLTSVLLFAAAGGRRGRG